MGIFLTATAPAPASLTDVMSGVSDIIKYLVGGGSGSDAVAFADSWVGSFLSSLVSANGLLFLGAVLSFTLFGIHVLKSLMNR